MSKSSQSNSNLGASETPSSLKAEVQAARSGPAPVVPAPTSQSTLPFITAYSPKLRTRLAFTGTGRTKQSFKDECDINKIMARFEKTGLIDFVNKASPHYTDCTGLDYQTAMETVSAARSLFEAMPSALRYRFENNPQKFLEFCENPENLPEMHKLGLLRPDYQPGGGGSPAPAAPPPAPLPASPAPTPAPQSPPST